MWRAKRLYDVGGVLLPRPFKLRRLGHFGLNVASIADSLRLYRNLLGFKVSDVLDFGGVPHLAEIVAGLAETSGVFMRYGTDHHAFVLFPKDLMARRGERAPARQDNTINQITWQCGSLREVVEAAAYFEERGVPVLRAGRDMPGSNWHVYLEDPDGHVNELYYGMEQIGWNGLCKPLPMYDRKFDAAPPLPQPSEEAEVVAARAKGVDLAAGRPPEFNEDGSYDVEGVLLPRPFKITKIGPVNLFVEDVAASLRFYRDILGFVFTEEATCHGRRCLFLRNGTEHHALALLPRELRADLGLGPQTSCMAFGLEVGSYRQLREAVRFLRQRGLRLMEGMPAELHPGIDYAAYVQDPDGHCLMLYFCMEQLGWDGTPRPPELRRRLTARAAFDDWPETLPAQPDTYVDQVFQGPLG
ncbi:MAG: VOC family protein [Candidatus Tectomicrobia bacterium]|nr:VOC family protein [Candidatus Tectomicrobia bacterium]